MRIATGILATLMFISCGEDFPRATSQSSSMTSLNELKEIKEDDYLTEKEVALLEKSCNALAYRANVYISDYVPRPSVLFNFDVRDNLCGVTTPTTGRFSGRVIQDNGTLSFASEFSNTIPIDTSEQGVLASFCEKLNGGDSDEEDDEEGGIKRFVEFGTGMKWLYMLDDNDSKCLSSGDNACAIVEEGFQLESREGKFKIQKVSYIAVDKESGSSTYGMVVEKNVTNSRICDGSSFTEFYMRFLNTSSLSL